MSSTFLDRLRRVIGDRPPYGWAADVGWNKGSTARVMKGHVPGAELLAPLSWIENARLDWLLVGRGTPYVVTKLPDDAAAQQVIGHHLEDSADWEIHLLASDVGFAVAFTMPAEIDVKGRVVPYTALEVFVGRLGQGVREQLHEQHRAGRVMTITAISADTWYQLQLGEIGSYQLLHHDDAILSERIPVPPMSDDPDSLVLDWDQLKVAEEPETYAVEMRPTGTGRDLVFMTPADHAFLDRLRRLAEADRYVIDQLVERLEKKPT